MSAAFICFSFFLFFSFSFCFFGLSVDPSLALTGRAGVNWRAVSMAWAAILGAKTGPRCPPRSPPGKKHPILSNPKASPEPEKGKGESKDSKRRGEVEIMPVFRGFSVVGKV